MSTVTSSVMRDVQHPWTGEPGWDLLLLQADEDDISKAVQVAIKRGWHLWCLGESDSTATSRAVFYKPAGRRFHSVNSKTAEGNWFDPTPWPEEF